MQEAFQVVSQPVNRIDSDKKVTGAQLFMSDVVLPGAVWATVIRSPYARADVITIDGQALKEAASPAILFTSDDVPDVLFNSAGEPPNEQLEAAADRRLLTSTAQHIGDGVAVVVADSPTKSLEASQHVKINWNVLSPTLDMDTALERGEVLCEIGGGQDTEALFASAHLVLEETFQTPAVQHVCLETHACAASIDPTNRRLTIWSNTQTPSDIRRLCAEILHIPFTDIRVCKLSEGGGFGSKQELYEEALVAWLAMKLEKPVQLRYTRQEEFTAGRGRHQARITVRLGFSQNGKLLACDLNALVDSGAYASHVPFVIGNILSAPYYTYPHALFRFTGTVVRTNTLTGGAYRGYGTPQAMFAVECLFDNAAQQLNIDPVELRCLNTTPLTDKQDRYFGAAGTGRLRKCLDVGKEFFHWSNARSEQGKDGWMRAEGMAMITMLNTNNPVPREATRAIVCLNEDGTVTLITGTCDCGTGSSTILAQIVAEELSIPLGLVQVLEGDTDSGLVDLGSFAQRTVYIGGGAARQASIDAREQLFEAVATIEQRPKHRLKLQNANIIDAEDENFSLSISNFCRYYACRGGIVGTATYRALGSPPSYSVCFVQVAVDPETGTVHVERCMNVLDCGRVLNPSGAAGQAYGGTMQGMGFATIEAWMPDNSGAGPLTIMDHGIPNALDIPTILPVFVEMSEETGPFGAKGLGEIPLPAVAPAIANAVGRATGVSITRLPLRPMELWYILQNKQ